jgi:hypothetical protein
MKWVLILTMGYPQGEPASTPFGVMEDRRACVIAGAGAARILAEANPGLLVGWTCIPQGGEAGA